MVGKQDSSERSLQLECYLFSSQGWPCIELYLHIPKLVFQPGHQATADTENTVNESDETDNTREETISVLKP